MNKLTQLLISPFIYESENPKQYKKTIALIPGGFKPVTLGHFYLVNEISKKSELDEVLVLVGHKNRDNVTKEDSIAIWNIYKKYLPSKVTIQLSTNPSPISDIHSIIKNNQENFYYPVVGMRGEQDLGDLKRFDSLTSKYSNFKPIVINSDLGVSGTKARAAILSDNFELFKTFLPTELSEEDKQQVWDIVHSKKSITENIDEQKQLLLGHIKSIQEFMIGKGMNVEPLPEIQFIDDDVENAKDFFGKTAYYNPNQRVIVLYTYNRHPKDITRSFTHEMIHHIQNIENRLGNIQTTNASEDDHLDKIEREAYEEGNITFRNWTESLPNISINENILSEGRYDKMSNFLSSEVFNHWKLDYEEGKSISQYEGEFENKDLYIEVNATIKYTPGHNKLTVDGGADSNTDYLELNFEVDPKLLPEMWSEISMNLKDVVRHEIEHLTHGDGDNLNPNKYIEDDSLIRDMISMELLPKAEYFKLEKEIDANLQGMYFRAKKEHRPFISVINSYLDAQDITSEEKEQILNIWRIRNKSLSLPKF